jgi:hypothetical protein
MQEKINQLIPPRIVKHQLVAESMMPHEKLKISRTPEHVRLNQESSAVHYT